MQKQKHGAHRTLVSDDTMAISDGGLRLDGEKESRDKSVHIIHTWSPRVILQMIQISPKKRKTKKTEEEMEDLLFIFGCLCLYCSLVLWDIKNLKF